VWVRETIVVSGVAVHGHLVDDSLGLAVLKSDDLSGLAKQEEGLVFLASHPAENTALGDDSVVVSIWVVPE